MYKKFILLSTIIATTLALKDSTYYWNILMNPSEINYNTIVELNSYFTRKSLNTKLEEYLPTNISDIHKLEKTEYQILDNKDDSTITIIDKLDLNDELIYPIVFKYSTTSDNKIDIEYYNIEEVLNDK